MGLLDSYKCNVVKFIPKCVRHRVGSSLCKIMKEIVKNCDNITLWKKLFLFSYFILKSPERGGTKNKTLSVLIENRLKDFELLDIEGLLPLNKISRSRRIHKVSEEVMKRLACAKIEDNNVKGALQILSEGNSIAPDTPETLQLLEEKHPKKLDDENRQTFTEHESFYFDPDSVIAAIQSFPTGSSGGIDVLTPQHAKDIFMNIDEGTDKDANAEVLSQFCNTIIQGKVPNIFRPIFFSARLIALKKPCGGIRPIAISSTFRRLCSKLVAYSSSKISGQLFQGCQLGINTKSGCEVAVHSTRQHLTDNINHAILKIDFSNAFNSIRRTAMLKEVNTHIRQASSYINSCYQEKSFLSNNGKIILSEEGVQQGDPLGPLLFCLTLQPIIRKLVSPLNLWYMDDGIIGGTMETVTKDYNLLVEETRAIGLNVKEKKCEIFNCPNTSNIFSQMKIIRNDNFYLLGSPLTRESCKSIMQNKLKEISDLHKKLKIIPKHHAFKVLQVSLGSPNLVSILRSSPCHATEEVENIDMSLKENLEEILNIRLSQEKWIQASLPIKFGGLGIRRPSALAIPAYLSSFLNAQNINEAIKDNNDFKTYWNYFTQETEKNEKPFLQTQKFLDENLIKKTFSHLYEILNEQERSRITSASHKRSGDWLKVVPQKKLGLHLDDDEFRHAVCLRLGLPVCEEFQCICGEKIDTFGHHCFVCNRNNGKILRHTMVNECVSRTLTSAGLPNKLEPRNISDCEHLRPDGVTLIPYKRGKSLAWDVSCPHPLCASHVKNNTNCGKLSTQCEELKSKKYSCLEEKYNFCPIIIDTIGAYGCKTEAIITEIGRLLKKKTGSILATSHFRQRLSIVLQKGNFCCFNFNFSFNL